MPASAPEHLPWLFSPHNRSAAEWRIDDRTLMWRTSTVNVGAAKSAAAFVCTAVVTRDRRPTSGGDFDATLRHRYATVCFANCRPRFAPSWPLMAQAHVGAVRTLSAGTALHARTGAEVP